MTQCGASCACGDWAKDDHAVCILRTAGAIVDRFTVEDTATGLKRLIKRLLGAEVSEARIEHG